jgi:hypothetical protein
MKMDMEDMTGADAGKLKVKYEMDAPFDRHEDSPPLACAAIMAELSD